MANSRVCSVVCANGCAQLYPTAWRDVGVAWFANLFGWLQDGSTLTLMGGLRGVATRLTLWLALLGGSLATASGRHVTIDVVSRSLGAKVRLPLLLLGGLLSAGVCFSAAYGYADFIATDAFDAKGSLAGPLREGLARRAFVVRRCVGVAAEEGGVDRLPPQPGADAVEPRHRHVDVEVAVEEAARRPDRVIGRLVEGDRSHLVVGQREAGQDVRDPRQAGAEWGDRVR